MRPAPWLHLEPYRQHLPNWEECTPGSTRGFFLITANSLMLKVMASDGNYKEVGLGPEYAWEHVSVSTNIRCPTWQEMDFVKDQFWLPEETVIQLHVPKHRHVNVHPYCLHLWRPLFAAIPLPPRDAVG
jgi:hypothetical protein